MVRLNLNPLETIKSLSSITFKGGLRTKVFQSLLVISIISFVIIIPSFASFSMRQIREVATSLNLSLISFIMLVLTIFLGVQIFYRDIENRSAHLTLSKPLSRDTFVLGKFSGFVAILGLSVALLTLFSIITLLIADNMYKADLPIRWENYLLSLFMEFVKIILIGSFAVLFSSFSTNLFLPLFGTLGVYIIGSASQSVYDYLQTAYGAKLPAVTVVLVKAVYYILPNLSLFDYKFTAIYNLSVNIGTALYSTLYAVLYITVNLSISIIVFRKREML